MRVEECVFWAGFRTSQRRSRTIAVVELGAVSLIWTVSQAIVRTRHRKASQTDPVIRQVLIILTDYFCRNFFQYTLITHVADGVVSYPRSVGNPGTRRTGDASVCSAYLLDRALAECDVCDDGGEGIASYKIIFVEWIAESGGGSADTFR